MRKYGKVDDNQNIIVRYLREVGAYVQSLAGVGNGCPDLLVGFRGKTYLMEIKDGDKTESKQALTPEEIFWHRDWQGGSLNVVHDELEALRIIGASSSRS